MNSIRKNIILEKNTLYFDFTASGLGYKIIEKKLQKVLLTYANTHSEISKNAKITQEYYQNARKSIRKCLEIDDSFYILSCGNGATASIKKFQEIMGIFIPPASFEKIQIKDKNNLPLVIVGPYEHHSNEISYREGLCEIKRIELDEFGEIDFKHFEKILFNNQKRQLIVSINHVSNVTGIKSDYKRLYHITKLYNGIFCLDTSASSAYMNVDCKSYDVLFSSPHKLLGGPGSSGLLVIKKQLCKNKKPTFSGGGVVSYVSKKKQVYFDDFEIIEDAGTPGLLQFIKAGFAYELRNEIGLDKIYQKEQEIKEYFLQKITKIPNITLYSKNPYLPIFAFNINHKAPFEVAKILNDTYNIQVRPGCNCAGPYGHDLLKLKENQAFKQKPGWVRVSLHYTHTKIQINKLLNAINQIAKL